MQKGGGVFTTVLHIINIPNYCVTWSTRVTRLAHVSRAARVVADRVGWAINVIVFVMYGMRVHGCDGSATLPTAFYIMMVLAVPAAFEWYGFNTMIFSARKQFIIELINAMHKVVEVQAIQS